MGRGGDLFTQNIFERGGGGDVKTHNSILMLFIRRSGHVHNILADKQTFTSWNLFRVYWKIPVPVELDRSSCSIFIENLQY